MITTRRACCSPDRICPRRAPGGYALLDNMPMGASRAVEGERLRQARETELARSIGAIDTVAEARVHLATPEASVFVRDKAEPSASVIVKLQPGRSLSDAQVRSIVNLVASSVPGMKPDAVTIVDQMGALLSKDRAGIERRRRAHRFPEPRRGQGAATAGDAAHATARRGQFQRRGAGRGRSRRKPGDAGKL
jgi:hypothetical protein